MIPRDLTLTREGETSLPLFAVVSNFVRLNLPAHKHVSDGETGSRKRRTQFWGTAKLINVISLPILVNIGIRAKRNEFYGG